MYTLVFVNSSKNVDVGNSKKVDDIKKKSFFARGKTSRAVEWACLCTRQMVERDRYVEVPKFFGENHERATLFWRKVDSLKKNRFFFFS